MKKKNKKKRLTCFDNCPYLVTKEKNVYCCELFDKVGYGKLAVKQEVVVAYDDMKEVRLMQLPLRNKMCLKVVRGSYPGPKTFKQIRGKML